MFYSPNPIWTELNLRYLYPNLIRGISIIPYTMLLCKDQIYLLYLPLNKLHVVISWDGFIEQPAEKKYIALVLVSLSLIITGFDGRDKLHQLLKALKSWKDSGCIWHGLYHIIICREKFTGLWTPKMGNMPKVVGMEII